MQGHATCNFVKCKNMWLEEVGSNGKGVAVCAVAVDAAIDAMVVNVRGGPWGAGPWGAVAVGVAILFECLQMRRGGRRWRTKTVAVGTGERIVWTAAAWMRNSDSVSFPCVHLYLSSHSLISSSSTLISILQTINYQRRQHGYGNCCIGYPRSTTTDC